MARAQNLQQLCFESTTKYRNQERVLIQHREGHMSQPGRRPGGNIRGLHSVAQQLVKRKLTKGSGENRVQTKQGTSRARGRKREPHHHPPPKSSKPPLPQSAPPPMPPSMLATVMSVPPKSFICVSLFTAHRAKTEEQGGCWLLPTRSFLLLPHSPPRRRAHPGAPAPPPHL